MSSYLVESYLARSRAHDFPEMVDRARAVSALLRAEGTPVSYLRSTFVPGDEVCLHFFEGPSIEAIRLVADRAGLAPDRISEALDGPLAPLPPGTRPELVSEQETS